MLKSLGGLIWGGVSDDAEDKDRATGLMLHAGQFYIYRPHQEGQCIYIDAQVIVQRTTEPYVTHITIERVFAEGEEDFLEPTDEPEQEQRTFRISEDMAFQRHIFQGSTTFTWRDTEASHCDDGGVYYRFVCDDETTNYHANNFEITVYQCMYEQKYQQSYTTAHEDDFREFEIRSSTFAAQFLSAGTIADFQDDESSATSEGSQQDQEDEDSDEDEEYQYECVAEFPGALHLFDISQKQFTNRGSSLSCQLLRGSCISGNSAYWLSVVDAKDRQQLSQRLDIRMALIFNPSNCGFIWNTPGDLDAGQYTWLFKLEDEDSLVRFRTIVSQCMKLSCNKHCGKYNKS
ncbi:hypothetical protein BGZ72_000213 [Mortierella alpina]|nr:hypothetical protein BGZ72_000213 [Mortierella alpina]